MRVLFGPDTIGIGRDRFNSEGKLKHTWARGAQQKGSAGQRYRTSKKRKSLVLRLPPVCRNPFALGMPPPAKKPQQEKCKRHHRAPVEALPLLSVGHLPQMTTCSKASWTALLLCGLRDIFPQTHHSPPLTQVLDVVCLWQLSSSETLEWASLICFRDSPATSSTWNPNPPSVSTCDSADSVPQRPARLHSFRCGVRDALSLY